MKRTIWIALMALTGCQSHTGSLVDTFQSEASRALGQFVLSTSEGLQPRQASRYTAYASAGVPGAVPSRGFFGIGETPYGGLRIQPNPDQNISDCTQAYFSIRKTAEAFDMAVSTLSRCFAQSMLHRNQFGALLMRYLDPATRNNFGGYSVDWRVAQPYSPGNYGVFGTYLMSGGISR